MGWLGRWRSRTHETTPEARLVFDEDGTAVFLVDDEPAGERYEVRTGVLVESADLPVGDVSQMVLDGVLVDLGESRLERPGDGAVTLILPVDDSPVPGVPVRIRLESGVRDVDLSDDEGIDVEPRTVRSVTHAGDGEFAIAYVDGALTFTAESFGVGVEELSLRRPPYLRVEPEEGSDGLVDLATAMADIPCSVDLDHIDLPDDLKDRLRRSADAYLEGDVGPEFDLEQDAIRAAVAAALPGSVVS
ncbi:hypothetical protein [Solicola sp. PLA-1-18]|uniref:hypothetical protein n=1 Tax=Solicola sp. PLA-1-18 TaxID=3380532 RepID=UPI003B81596E